jgi:hypothetical protein
MNEGMKKMRKRKKGSLKNGHHRGTKGKGSENGNPGVPGPAEIVCLF